MFERLQRETTQKKTKKKSANRKKNEKKKRKRKRKKDQLTQVLDNGRREGREKGSFAEGSVGDTIDDAASIGCGSENMKVRDSPERAGQTME
jgi:hypothetical protein